METETDGSFRYVANLFSSLRATWSVVSPAIMRSPIISMVIRPSIPTEKAPVNSGVSSTLITTSSPSPNVKRASSLSGG
jgi:hypothetical protein